MNLDINYHIRLNIMPHTFSHQHKMSFFCHYLTKYAELELSVLILVLLVHLEVYCRWVRLLQADGTAFLPLPSYKVSS